MDIKLQKDEQLDKVAQLIKEIRYAMLTTLGSDGSLHSRPMATLQFDDNACLWFYTGIHSSKIDDLAARKKVNLAYARTDKQDYLSIVGTAEVVHDRSKMEELWTPWLKPWFREGLDDPELALLKVRVEQADYWDAPDSVALRLYGLAKGMLTGNTDALGEHGSVQHRH